MATNPWRKLMNIAARQHQVFTTSQATGCDIPATTLRRTARRMGIVDLGRGLWACGGSPNTYRRKLTAATLSVEGALTGRSALWLRRVIAATPRQVDLLIGPQVHHRGSPGVSFFRGAPLDCDDTINIEGFRTVPVYRAFTDVAAVVPMESLTRWLPAMDRLRLGDLDGLEEYAARRGRFVGVVNLRAAVTVLRADLPHSGAERFARKTLRAAGIPPYVRPYPVREGGRTLAEIDLAYPAALYGAEVDGPHHLLPAVAKADKARDRVLARRGWTIERFPHDEVLSDPAGFVAEVRRGLAGAKRAHAEVSHPLR